MPRLPLVFALALSALAFAASITPALAQRYPPRAGVGFEAMATLPSQDIVPEGLGVGLRARLSVPVNRDVSIGAETGFVGFVLSGQDDAAYVFNPQLSVILTLPTRGSARYLLGGVGGFFPLGDGDGFEELNGGPALHLGLGWAFPLRETSLFVEVNPSLIVGTEEATAALPVRVGVIF